MNEPLPIDISQSEITELSNAARVKLGLFEIPPQTLPFLGPLSDIPLAHRIEHTLLRIDATEAAVMKLCDEALAEEFRSVCCLPRDVDLCRRLLANTEVLVVTVLGFPLCGAIGKAIWQECARALDAGADEVDLVADVRALLRGDLTAVRDHIAMVVEQTADKPVKVILETGVLPLRSMVEGVAVAESAGASFVKTSTGFCGIGATVEAVSVLRLAAGSRLGVKASGGINTREAALSMICAGADLIGTSSGLKMRLTSL